MTQDDILAILRHILTMAGTGLIAKGYVTSDEWTGLSGGAVALAMIGWSLYQKSQQREAVHTALMTPPPTN